MLLRDSVLLNVLLLLDLEYRVLSKAMLEDVFAGKAHVGLIPVTALHAFLLFGHPFCGTCAFAPKAPFGLALLGITMFRELGSGFGIRDPFNFATTFLLLTLLLRILAYLAL